MLLVPHAEQAWPGTAASVGEARRFVTRTLAGWGAEPCEWPAAALVSELATNAVLHAGTTFSVSLTLDDDRLRLEVRDGSTARPVVRNYGEDATTGRGLRLVVQLSEQWGVEPQTASKTVWCVLTVRAPVATTEPEDDVDVEELLAQFDDVGPAESASRSSTREGVHGRQVA
jgi:anti-sigma regulatory factor (Ser/Thr protein kinase)